MVDTHSRYCPAADARFTYRGEDVVQTLESICRKTGYPRTIRVDNGSQFISRDLDLWAYANNVNRHANLTPYRRPMLTPMLTISTWIARRWPGLQRANQVRVMGLFGFSFVSGF